MAEATFTAKVDPTYDDLPEQRYHFPRAYLRPVEAARNNWIIYYEPRRSSGNLSSRGGRQSYFATARIADIILDSTQPDHFYASIDSYLDFARPVPFREDRHYHESTIRREDGKTNKGAFGRAVRGLPDREYDAILQAAFAPILGQMDETPRGFRDPYTALLSHRQRSNDRSSNGLWPGPSETRRFPAPSRQPTTTRAVSQA